MEDEANETKAGVPIARSTSDSPEPQDDIGRRSPVSDFKTQEDEPDIKEEVRLNSNHNNSDHPKSKENSKMWQTCNGRADLPAEIIEQ